MYDSILVVQTSFFVQSMLVFSGVTTLVALSFTPASKPLWMRLGVGATVATVVLAGLAYMLLAKGAKFGDHLVSRPQFLPATHPARSSTASESEIAPVVAAAVDGASDRAKKD